MSPDFMLSKYAELCRLVRELPFEIMTIKEFLDAGQPKRRVLMLRHDVDRSLNSALRMAELEARLGIGATYYIRATPAVFRPKALLHLHALGHEVGYHYEVLAKAKGNQEQAIGEFERELARFRQVVPVATISMHGSPHSRWNNLDLWRDRSYLRYGVDDASLSIDYQRIYYFTDTGRTWDPDRHNLRDHVASRRPASQICMTDELIGFLRSVPDSPIVITAHPNRWAASRWEWTIGLLTDFGLNHAKRVARLSHMYLSRSPA